MNTLIAVAEKELTDILYYTTLYMSVCLCVCIWQLAMQWDQVQRPHVLAHTHPHTCPGCVRQDPIIPLLPAILWGVEFFFLRHSANAKMVVSILFLQTVSSQKQLDLPHYINAATDRPLTHTEGRIAFMLTLTHSSSRVLCVSIIPLLIKGSPAGPHRGNLPLKVTAAPPTKNQFNCYPTSSFTRYHVNTASILTFCYQSHSVSSNTQVWRGQKNLFESTQAVTQGENNSVGFKEHTVCSLFSKVETGSTFPNNILQIRIYLLFFNNNVHVIAVIPK